LESNLTSDMTVSVECRVLDLNDRTWNWIGYETSAKELALLQVLDLAIPVICESTVSIFSILIIDISQIEVIIIERTYPWFFNTLFPFGLVCLVDLHNLVHKG
jgi:hypothetical protein